MRSRCRDRGKAPYPQEFHREAIKLALLGDKPPRKLAKKLSAFSDAPFRDWLKQERAESGERSGGSRDGREELRPLRDENAKLRTKQKIPAKPNRDHARSAVTPGPGKAIA
jgi:transposase-like protein